ncbi:UNVERIFIED_CONTAM: cytochrome [Sesamum calycinum]|uniref:Cytochrome n=1 Tax=Sesamum calycinum TaxID=2727403 RepID=A0AAW2R8C4_9LAMI
MGHGGVNAQLGRPQESATRARRRRRLRPESSRIRSRKPHLPPMRRERDSPPPPPIPLLLHETAADAVVDGYKIPAKARVMINAWAIAREHGAWDEPNTFKPSRFLESGAPDFRGSNFEYIPFGSGRRSCPGMQLGLYALELTVAHLCHSFNWELPDGMNPDDLDMNDVFGLTAPRAVQLVAIPKHRLNFPLF